MLRFLKRRSYRKVEEQIHSEILSGMAVQPASVDVHLLLDRVKQIFTAYLYAYHNLDMDALPMECMEEQFFYQTGQQIRTQLIRLKKEGCCSRCVNLVSLDDIRLEDYDNSLIYAVRTITYRVSYRVSGVTISVASGEVPFIEQYRAAITYLNDSRLGWILSQVEEDRRTPI